MTVIPAAWERYGRLLIERQALAADRRGAVTGVIGSDEVALLSGRPEQHGPSREEVHAAFAPLLSEARQEFLAELDGPGPLARIARYAGLAELDATVLAVCAAVELDHGTAALLGAATAAPDVGGATVAALRTLLGNDGAVAVADDAPLRRGALVRLTGGGPLGTTTVQLARRVSWALLDDYSLDPDLPGDVELALAPPESDDGPDRVLVNGPDRVRRLQAAVRATAGTAFLLSEPPTDERGWEALVAQATVVGAGLVLDLPESTEERPRPFGAVARRWLDRATHLPIALCATHPVPLEILPRQRWVEVSAGDSEVNAAEWNAVFDDAPLPARLPTASQLRSVELVATSAGDPAHAMRRLTSGTLLRHARRVEARATWSDLILPPSQARKLRGLVERYHNRDQVHAEWGLPLYPSPGIVALFSGPSGTGKTTSAEVIAAELGVDLFRVDLSALVSKYIGETEKNLEEIFSAAHSGDYLLLFDEADSLFGSRSEVTDARDRYANMEVSYLLQRLETYDGFVVLTSNFQGNIDDAFLRRIHATISFPLPSPEDRARIWSRSLAAAPLGEVDLEHLATAFELSGGSIRNAALTAAYLAAARGGPVGMVELLTAVSDELGKLRQRVGPHQLGEWADEVAALG